MDITQAIQVLKASGWVIMPTFTYGTYKVTSPDKAEQRKLSRDEVIALAQAMLRPPGR